MRASRRWWYGAGALAGALALTSLLLIGAARGPADAQRRAEGAISFIDSPSPTCYRPDAGTNACFIEWSYLSAIASSGAYLLTMTVSIDDRMRAYHSGFFQDEMFIPAGMTAPGYRVACGPPGRSPGGMGNSYGFVIRARESTGLGASNHGTVTCPGDVPRLYLPLVRR